MVTFEDSYYTLLKVETALHDSRFDSRNEKAQIQSSWSTVKSGYKPNTHLHPTHLYLHSLSMLFEFRIYFMVFASVSVSEKSRLCKSILKILMSFLYDSVKNIVLPNAQYSVSIEN